jgi:transcription antitermination factor NusG
MSITPISTESNLSPKTKGLDMDCKNWNAPDSAQWYAVWTRSRQEKTAAAMLDALGVSHFLPLVSEERQWSDRKKKVMVPIFPGYLFVQIVATSDLELRVQQVSGVVNFVGNQNGPSAISEDEIENLRTLLARSSMLSEPFSDCWRQSSYCQRSSGGH